MHTAIWFFFGVSMGNCFGFLLAGLLSAAEDDDDSAE